MLVLLVAEAAAIALLGLLVVGLLRSHAEILRALHDLGADTAHAGGTRRPVDVTIDRPQAAHEIHPQPGVAVPRDDFPVAHDLVGVTPDGEALAVGVVGAPVDTVVAFLSSGCSTCRDFWSAFADPRGLALPRGTRLVVVAKSPEEESVSRLRELAPPDLPVVLSSAAWRDYEVPVAPYVVLVEGSTGRVRGEGAARTWTQVAELLGQAAADLDGTGASAAQDRAARAARIATADLVREARVDRELAAAGLHPGDARLYPQADRDLRA